jgi:hypothetical protein
VVEVASDWRRIHRERNRRHALSGLRLFAVRCGRHRVTLLAATTTCRLMKEAAQLVVVGARIYARTTDGASIVAGMPCVVTNSVRARLAVVDRVDGLPLGARADIIAVMTRIFRLFLLSGVEARGVLVIKVLLANGLCFLGRNGNRPRRLVGITQPDIAATRAVDRNLAEGDNKGAHKLGSPTSAEAFVRPVALMTDLHAELELVHLGNTNNLYLDLGVKIAAVDGIPNKGEKLLLQCIDILERCVPGGKDGDLLPHGRAASDVLDPEVVEDDVGGLGDFAVVNTLKDGIKEGNVLYSKLVRANVDAVTNIVRVLDEEEDARTEHLLTSSSEDEGER